MTSSRAKNQARRLSAIVAAVSGCISALVGVASAAQNYSNVALMPEKICGENADIIKELQSNPAEVFTSPAHLIDQRLWERAEVESHHRGQEFAKLRQKNFVAYKAYLDIWWQEATRVENCLNDFKSAYEQSPGWLKLVYPSHTKQTFRVAQKVILHIQLERNVAEQ